MIRYGGGGGRTSVVCGYLHCDDPTAFSALVGVAKNALPPAAGTESTSAAA